MAKTTEIAMKITINALIMTSFVFSVISFFLKSARKSRVRVELETRTRDESVDIEAERTRTTTIAISIVGSP